MKQTRGPLAVAIVLLLLPVLYMGSYFALVEPGPGHLAMTASGECKEFANYRFGSEFCRRLFWPLEQIDRKVRPGAWGVSEEDRRAALKGVRTAALLLHNRTERQP